jgi:hypothetical protein
MQPSMKRAVETDNIVLLETFAQKRAMGSAFLQPNAIELRLRAREDFQSQKFRTNCTDCVPNL